MSDKVTAALTQELILASMTFELQATVCPVSVQGGGMKELWSALQRRQQECLLQQRLG